VGVLFFDHAITFSFIFSSCPGYFLKKILAIKSPLEKKWDALSPDRQAAVIDGLLADAVVNVWTEEQVLNVVDWFELLKDEYRMVFFPGLMQRATGHEDGENAPAVKNLLAVHANFSASRMAKQLYEVYKTDEAAKALNKK
jgi:hypothetical protein